MYMINRLHIVHAFDWLRHLINILIVCKAVSCYFASMAHGTATWANKFKWKPVLHLFPRYFIPLSWTTAPCKVAHTMKVRLVKFYNSCSQEMVTCYDVPNMWIHCREKAVSIKLSILWLRKASNCMYA